MRPKPPPPTFFGNRGPPHVQVDVGSLVVYFNFDAGRKEDLIKLDRAIRIAAPKLKRHLCGASRSERLDGPGQDWHLYQYDEPWVACLVASRKLTRHFTLGSTATYHSGSLFTPIYARADSTAWYPDWYTGQPFSQRVADYFRWDMRGDYTWYFHRGSLDVYLDFLNLTGNVNPMGRAYSSDRPAAAGVLPGDGDPGHILTTVFV